MVKYKKKDEYKTEFLFESDAERVILNTAIQKKKPCITKTILINSFIIITIIITLFYYLDKYETKEIIKIKGLIASSKDEYINIEVLNKYNSELKSYTPREENNKYLILVNKQNKINERSVSNYELVDVKDNLYGTIKLEKETYNSFVKLKENLLKRGYYINITSGFRTFDESNSLYNMNKAKYEYLETAGTSEHNTGLAFDFTISKNNTKIKTNYESDEYSYLKNIAYLYGFIIRYPKDKEKVTGYYYKPDHLRYVGKSAAKYLAKNNLTLEEYYEW